MNLAIVITARCNAACAHCSTGCGPDRTESLESAEIFRLMDEAAAIDDGTPLTFELTGGEAFLDFEKLIAIVAYGSGLGAKASCTTNAYWAVSRDAAHAKLSRLVASGLTRLAVSTSRFHRQFVPLRRVRIALDVASELGLKPELKGAMLAPDIEAGGEVAEWQQMLQAHHVNIFPILPHLRPNASIAEADYYREPGLPEQRCPGAQLCVEADGSVASCCAPGISTGFLTLGSVRELSLAELQRRFERLGKQRILREHGPILFARAAIDSGQGHRLRASYAGPCDLCLHVGTDPQLMRIADQVSAVTDLANLHKMLRFDPIKPHEATVESDALT